MARKISGSGEFWDGYLKREAAQVDWRSAVIDYWSCRQQSDYPPAKQSNRYLLRLLSMPQNLLSIPQNALGSMLSKKVSGSTGIEQWYERWASQLGLGFALHFPAIIAEKAEHNPKLARLLDTVLRTLQSTLRIGSFSIAEEEPELISQLEEVFPKTLNELRDVAVQNNLIKLVTQPLKHRPELNPYKSTDLFQQSNGRLVSLYDDLIRGIWMNTAFYAQRDELAALLYQPEKSGAKACFDVEYRRMQAEYVINLTLGDLSFSSEHDQLTRLKKIFFNLLLAQNLIEDNFTQSLEDSN